jgi:hypothetical protein
MEKKKFLTDTQKDRATECPAANLKEKFENHWKHFMATGTSVTTRNTRTRVRSGDEAEKQILSTGFTQLM